MYSIIYYNIYYNKDLYVMENIDDQELNLDSDLKRTPDPDPDPEPDGPRFDPEPREPRTGKACVRVSRRLSDNNFGSLEFSFALEIEVDFDDKEELQAKFLNLKNFLQDEVKKALKNYDETIIERKKSINQ